MKGFGIGGAQGSGCRVEGSGFKDQGSNRVLRGLYQGCMGACGLKAVGRFRIQTE